MVFSILYIQGKQVLHHTTHAKWDYGTLKRKSGLKDKELGAALGWLACEDKIVLHQEDGELYIFLGVNVYIG